MKLLIVEDHALVRDGMVLTLQRLDPHLALLEASDASAALELIERNPDLDLVLLDLMLPDENGLLLLQTLRARHPMLPVIVVSALEDASTVRRAIQAGANGFVAKSSSSDVLIDAVQAVLAGGLFIPDDNAATSRAGDGSRLPGEVKELDLTDAQKKVFNLLVQGLSNREIAMSLGLTEGTVKVHVSKILRSLGVTSRAQAMVVAARLSVRH